MVLMRDSNISGDYFAVDQADPASQEHVPFVSLQAEPLSAFGQLRVACAECASLDPFTACSLRRKPYRW